MAERFRSFRAEAVVLRHWDWGEADRMLVLFTLQTGKTRAIAKGIRKPRSRKAGHLEPFTQASIQFARGRDLLIVTQAETIQAFLPLHEDFLLATYASYVVELLDRFTYEEGENPPLYRLLLQTLERLSAGDNPDLVVRFYEMRLLDLMGFRPQLFECAQCGTPIQAEDQFFSSELGGVLCPACGKDRPGVRPVSMPALKYLRHLQRSSYQEAARAQIPPETNREMEVLMQHYLTYILERSLNSPPFLRRARTDSQGSA